MKQLTDYFRQDQVRALKKKKLNEHQLRLLLLMCENHVNDLNLTYEDWRVACQAEFGFNIFPPPMKMVRRTLSGGEEFSVYRPMTLVAAGGLDTDVKVVPQGSRKLDDLECPYCHEPVTLATYVAHLREKAHIG